MKTLISAVAATLLIGAACASVQAQHPEAANASKYGIAVVDISYIFKEHKSFLATMDNMKQEMQGLEQTLKSKREGIAQMEEAHKKLDAGSADYKKADDDLAAAKAKFNLEMDRLRKDLMERESKVYFQTYQQVNYAIANYAKERKIGLVLRFNGDQPDPNNRNDILKWINKPVVFENNIDITRDILAVVNGGAATSIGGRPAQPPQ
ncbi:MAG: OmpH family outer membrane protein [Aeoliella sp.]